MVTSAYGLMRANQGVALSMSNNDFVQKCQQIK